MFNKRKLTIKEKATLFNKKSIQINKKYKTLDSRATHLSDYSDKLDKIRVKRGR